VLCVGRNEPRSASRRELLYNPPLVAHSYAGCVSWCPVAFDPRHRRGGRTLVAASSPENHNDTELPPPAPAQPLTAHVQFQ